MNAIYWILTKMREREKDPSIHCRPSFIGLPKGKKGGYKMVAHEKIETQGRSL